MMRRPSPFVLVPAVLLFTAALFPHYSWILPSGKNGQLEIGHGHSFPVSEQAMNPDRIRVILYDGPGSSIPGVISREKGFLSVSPSMAVPKIKAAAFIEEPLILNRTTKGVRTGPMSGLTGVIDSFRRHRCGLFQAAPAGWIAPLEKQLTLTYAADENGPYLLCRLGEKTVSGLEIERIGPDSKTATAIGRSDESGRLPCRMEETGAYLFSASLSQPCGDGDTQREEYRSTLVLLKE